MAAACSGRSVRDSSPASGESFYWLSISYSSATGWDGAGYLSYLSPQIDGFLSISGYRNLVGTTTVSAVPEPGSLGLYAAGLAFVGLCARRRPRAAQHPSAA